MIKEVWGRISGMSRKRRIYLGLALVLTLVLIGIIIYILFIRVRICGTLQCFEDASARCERARYLNEDLFASWKYEILGMRGDGCAIRVTLANAKQGELGMDKIVGYDMICYEDGAVSNPEKDLSRCHGRLKEELLYSIIQNLHTYVIDNLGEIGKIVNESAGA